MSQISPRFSKLLQLAGESSSEKRRELLRDVTDLFFATTDTRTDREAELFDNILCSIAQEMPQEALVSLSRRFATAADAPQELVKRLAQDVIEVAQPVLTRSRQLSDEDLIGIVLARSQEHIRAVAVRSRVSSSVSDAIVQRGDDQTLGVLVANEGARLSRSALETVVDRARINPELQEGVVHRRDMPLDLLNELYFDVQQRLREAILERNAAMDPAELDAALLRARGRLRQEAQAVSDDLRKAEKDVRALSNAGRLDGASLLGFHRAEKPHHFLAGLAEMTGLDYESVRSILRKRDLDALAMICRASEMERALFVSLAVLCEGGEAGMRRAEEFGKLYAQVPAEAAQRAMRFYRVRKTSEHKAA